MKNFSKGDFKGGFKGGFRGGNRGDDRGPRPPMTMHSAICSSCGKNCEVPFRPTGDKPVYCRDCFAGRSAMGGDRSNRKDFRKENRDVPQNTGGSDEIKKQLEAMNVKLDKLINVMQGFASVKTAPVAAPAVVPIITSKAAPAKIETKMLSKKVVDKAGKGKKAGKK